MFLRNNVFPRDAVNPKGKFYPIFGRGAARAHGRLFGEVPVNLMCPVSLAPAVCMQRSILAGFLKLTLSSFGGVCPSWLLRKFFVLSSLGLSGGPTHMATNHGWLWLVRKTMWFSQAICDKVALCPVLASSSRMVCREPVRLFVG
jgi:hypothetical protein